MCKYSIIADRESVLWGKFGWVEFILAATIQIYN
jgi:hypothetical protein